jgi:predicted TIM-barrel fold metal-dependent hydrolase
VPAINDWVAEYCRDTDGRVVGVGRHPRLRLGLVECGAVWAHSYVHRLDEHVEKWPSLLGVDVTPGVKLSRKPSEYRGDQCFVSVEEVEPGLPDMPGAYPNCVIFATDYPHPDAKFPGSADEILESPQLTPEQIRAVCRTNALRLYGSDESAG